MFKLRPFFFFKSFFSQHKVSAFALLQFGEQNSAVQWKESGSGSGFGREIGGSF